MKVYRWLGLFWGSVVGFLIVLGMPDPPAHHHAHAWALAFAIPIGCQQVLFLLGVIADEVTS